MARRAKDPLAPIEFMVSLVWGLMLLSLLAAVPFLLVVETGSWGGLGPGSPEVCVEATPSDAVWGAWGTGEPETSGEGFAGLRDGVTESPSLVTVCDPEPDTALRVIEVVEALIDPVGGLAFFGWLRRVLRVARREGVFADRVPKGLSRLGVFLLGWMVVQWLGGTLLDSLVFHRMLAGESLAVLWRDPPLAMLLGGVGLVTVGRVMHHAVVLRRDVEATI